MGAIVNPSFLAPIRWQVAVHAHAPDSTEWPLTPIATALEAVPRLLEGLATTVFACARKSGCVQASVGLQVVSAERIEQLGTQYRVGVRHDHGCLSFPLEDTFPIEIPSSYFHARPKQKNFPLGDILLCPTHIHPPHTGIQLALHSFLHLLGYDHASCSDAFVMQQLEHALLQGLDHAPVWWYADAAV